MMTHRCFEYEEKMIAVVRVQSLTYVAQILCAISTAEPFTLDRFHTSITECGSVADRPQVCFERRKKLVNLCC